MRRVRIAGRVPVLSSLIALAGGIIVLLGLADAFLTILHPDRDGRFSAIVNKTVWRIAIVFTRVRPRARQEVLGFAGPLMVIADVILWMMLPILGYGLMIWPFMSAGFDGASILGADLWDAIYFSGVTFTTLGFGDITPVAPAWEVLSIAEAVTGFLVMSTSIAYIVAVFEGVDQRDALALKIYSETSGSWNGALFVTRALEEEGPEGLRVRVEEWAALVRDLHGRLYRFHGLALYLRTHGLDLGPERMIYAMSDVALRCQVIARARELPRLHMAADHLALGVEHFSAAIVRRHGTRAARRAMEAAEPTERDRALVRDAWDSAADRFHFAAPVVHPVEDPRVLALAARLRIFLGELDRITRWRTLDRDSASRERP